MKKILACFMILTMTSGRAYVFGKDDKRNLVRLYEEPEYEFKECTSCGGTGLIQILRLERVIPSGRTNKGGQYRGPTDEIPPPFGAYGQEDSYLDKLPPDGGPGGPGPSDSELSTRGGYSTLGVGAYFTTATVETNQPASARNDFFLDDLFTPNSSQN